MRKADEINRELGYHKTVAKNAISQRYLAHVGQAQYFFRLVPGIIRIGIEDIQFLVLQGAVDFAFRRPIRP